MARSGFVYNKNGSEWLKVNFYGHYHFNLQATPIFIVYKSIPSHSDPFSLYKDPLRAIFIIITIHSEPLRPIFIVYKSTPSHSDPFLLYKNPLRATPTHFYCIQIHFEQWKWVGVVRSGFLFNENGSDWFGVDFYSMKMGRNGSEWICIQ